ncbi:type II toxin-antitoxin system VapC family toxin [Mycolicibacterium sp. ND9-15]|uniref:type II toxin-antitoxin system VapC family toxin n=1 Tax=Mycolicibacterium sp. ND9-15 TaxID=3042320 RepID=UPI002DDBB568|nr:type II toxin-antitoxin system VapC family toxin [Mycolicibacterium sp. ND9-15]WSE57755.1 type II toxin-antitoxin system VapC family toxin [Mycolicibacterium sp. ND9-15]
MTTDRPAAGILDTSVFIANENGRQLEMSLIPEELATTVVTLAELNAGVLAARNSEVRARRLRTLDAVADMTALPVDEDAAQLSALLRVHLAEAGRRVRINDLWIAAIAAAKQLPVVTQDGDFDVLEGVAGLAIVHV